MRENPFTMVYRWFLFVGLTTGATFAAGFNEPTKLKTARSLMAVLGKAVEIYQFDYGTPPPTLETLFEMGPKGGPYLDERRALFDPWGVEFRYDPKGPRNLRKGKAKVDIWSNGSGKVISNWE